MNERSNGDIPYVEELETIHVSNLTAKKFYSHLVQGRPLLIRDLGKSWPAFKLWNDEYVNAKIGDLEGDVEMKGDNQFANFKKGYGRQRMRVGDFLSRYSVKDRTTNYYLAEYDLPKPLWPDITSPPFTSFMTPLFTKFWLGAGGTQSLPHTDFEENIMVMLAGTKQFVITQPADRRLIYTGVGVPPHYSAVDFFNPDLKRFPKFKDATAIHVTLRAGDALYLPAYWFHHVRSEGDRVLAVNMWYATHSALYQGIMGCVEHENC